MKLYITILPVLLALWVHGQESFPFLTKDHKDYINIQKDKDIVDVYRSSSNIVVKKATGSKIRYPIDSVFLYRTANADLYRIYQGKEYKILVIDGLSIYTRSKTLYKTRKREYFFSKGLIEDLHLLTENNLYKVFYPTDSSFLNAVKHEFKWHENLWKQTQPSIFKIVELYRKYQMDSYFLKDRD